MRKQLLVVLGLAVGSWVVLAGLFSWGVGVFEPATPGRVKRLLCAGGMASVVMLGCVRILVEGRSRNAFGVVKAHILGRRDEGIVLLEVVVDAMRFAISWTYLLALGGAGIAYGIDETRRTGTNSILPSVEGIGDFLHWGLSLGATVLFLDALLHICVLVRRADSKEVLYAIVSGLTGLGLIMLLPLKELPLSVFHVTEGGHATVSADAVARMSGALWLPLSLIVGVNIALAGLLYLRERMGIEGR